MASSDPTSSSRQRLTGVKPREWFLGATFARLIAADVGRGADVTDRRLDELHDIAARATDKMFPPAPIPLVPAEPAETPTPPTPPGFLVMQDSRMVGYVDYERERHGWVERVTFDYETKDWYACRKRATEGDCGCRGSDRLPTVEAAVAWLNAQPITDD